MSIQLMTAVWEMGGLNAAQKLVLLCLADHANDKGMCWPSVDRIAERSDMSKRNCQRVLGALEEMGHIARVEGGHGRGRTNLYVVKVGENKGDNLSPQGDEKGDTQGQKGDNLSQKGDTQGRKGDIAVSPEPIEPSRKQPSEESEVVSLLHNVPGWGWLTIREGPEKVQVMVKDVQVAERQYRKQVERTLASAGLSDVRVEFAVGA